MHNQNILAAFHFVESLQLGLQKHSMDGLSDVVHVDNLDGDILPWIRIDIPLADILLPL